MLIRNGRKIGHGGLDLGPADDPNASAKRSSNETPGPISERAKGRGPGSAFQEGADTALLHQAPINPYRRAMRAVRDPASLEALGKLAQEWEDGYVSNHR